MNIIIVGAGGHATTWKANINALPECKLVGIVDNDHFKLENQWKMWGVREDCAYPTISDAVRYTDEKIDAAIIATPINTHHVLAIEALENGLNVICEKNMASTIEGARAMVKLAQAHPELCTSMGTQYRYRPTWWTLRQLLTGKELPIGKLSHIRGYYVHRQGEMRYGWRSYLRDIYAEDMLAHHVDVLRYSTGMEIVEVQAQVYKPRSSKWYGTSTVSLNLTFAPRGEESNKDKWVRGHYYGDWQSRGGPQLIRSSFEFMGDLGSIAIEPSREPQKGLWERTATTEMVGEPAGSELVAYLDDPNLVSNTREVILKRQDIEGNPKNLLDQQYILDELSQCIKSGGKQQPKINFEEGFRTFLVTQAAIESSRTGLSIWVPKYWLNPVQPPLPVLQGYL